MIRAVRGSGLGVSSTSTAQTCPAYGLVSRLGQWTSASGRCPARAGTGWAARRRRSECHQAWPGPRPGGLEPQPGGEHGADVRQARQRRAGGGVAEPGGSHAGRGQPAPGRAGSQPPGGGEPGPAPPRDDPAQPGGLRAQRGREQVIGCAVVLGAQDQAVDVAAAQPYRRRSRSGAGSRCGRRASGPVMAPQPACCPARHRCQCARLGTVRDRFWRAGRRAAGHTEQA